jgi:hypothetical protein
LLLPYLIRRFDFKPAAGRPMAPLTTVGTNNNVIFISNTVFYYLSRTFTMPTAVMRGTLGGSTNGFTFTKLTKDSDAGIAPLWLSPPEYFVFNSGNETNVQGWFFKCVIVFPFEFSLLFCSVFLFLQRECETKGLTLSLVYLY